jgi:hypothetical protein
MKELLLDIMSCFKADVATATVKMETLNYNFKTENTKLAKDIPSRMTLMLRQNTKQETQKISNELTENFRADTDKLKEEDTIKENSG